MLGRTTGPLHPLHTPANLPPERLMTWCRQRTRLDEQRATRKGKKLSQNNITRLLKRRLNRAKLPE